MYIDIYLIDDINAEIKSCAREGVTSNPCRFYGGTFAEGEIENLLPKLRNPSGNAVYPVPAANSEHTDRQGLCLHFLRNASGAPQGEVEQALSEVADGYEHLIHEATRRQSPA